MLITADCTDNGLQLSRTSYAGRSAITATAVWYAPAFCLDDASRDYEI